eukprot:SAG11_NODE_6571_length_1286_cov_3.796967_2_plen_212_part_00
MLRLAPCPTEGARSLRCKRCSCPPAQGQAASDLRGGACLTAGALGGAHERPARSLPNQIASRGSAPSLPQGSQPHLYLTNCTCRYLRGWVRVHGRAGAQGEAAGAGRGGRCSRAAACEVSWPRQARRASGRCAHAVGGESQRPEKSIRSDGRRSARGRVAAAPGNSSTLPTCLASFRIKRTGSSTHRGSEDAAVRAGPYGLRLGNLRATTG